MSCEDEVIECDINNNLGIAFEANNGEFVLGVNEYKYPQNGKI